MDAEKTVSPVPGQAHEPDMVSMAGQIVTAMIQTSGGAIAPAQVPDLIKEVYGTLQTLSQNVGTAPQPPQAPAVPVKDSITDNYLVCLEDGKTFKMLKRHLRTVYNMSPEQYRAKWGLPGDYPMTCPNYAKTRSRLAKESGLGCRREARNAA